MQNISYTAGTNGNVGLRVTVFNASGCTASAATNVLINALPSAPSITAASSVCSTSSGNTASVASASAYAWTITNGVITSATNLQSITYTAGTSGNVGLRVTVFNGSGCTASAATNVLINALPATPSLTLVPFGLCGLSGQSTGNLASGPAGATTYAWTITNGMITSATNLQMITFTAGASGNVRLTLTVFNGSGCNATATTNATIFVDNLAPTIACLTNRVIFVAAGVTATNISYSTTATDNCDPNPVVTFSPPSGSSFAPGLTTVTVTAVDKVRNTNTCTFTVRVHPAPTVELVNPTNNSIYVAPQNIFLLANASVADGNISQVAFYRQATNPIAAVTSGYTFDWTNAPLGTNALIAVATDNFGLTATSAVANVTLLAHVPLPPGSILVVETNTLRVRQTGLLYQLVTVTNPTPLTMDAIRLTISNLPPVVRVWNANGTNAGLPFLLYNQPVTPGGAVTFTVEYYVSDGHTLPNPVFIADLVPAVTTTNVNGTPMDIIRTVNRPGIGLLVEFSTLANRIYYVQYSVSPAGPWRTATPAITGTGSSIQWLDNGPPKTESNPASVSQRFYRILLVP